MNAEQRIHRIQQLRADRAITREQFLLARKANALLTCMEHLIPGSVMHSAVEDARRATFQLLRHIEGIHTYDYLAYRNDPEGPDL